MQSSSLSLLGPLLQWSAFWFYISHASFTKPGSCHYQFLEALHNRSLWGLLLRNPFFVFLAYYSAYSQLNTHKMYLLEEVCVIPLITISVLLILLVSPHSLVVRFHGKPFLHSYFDILPHLSFPPLHYSGKIRLFFCLQAHTQGRWKHSTCWPSVTYCHSQQPQMCPWHNLFYFPGLSVLPLCQRTNFYIVTFISSSG